MNENGKGKVDGRIIAVAHDPAVVRFTLHVLGERGGFDVIHVADPVTAIRRIRSEPWDLVLADFDLPRMSGLDLAEWVSGTKPELPVAVIVARHIQPEDLALLLHHATEVLHMPVPPMQLIAIVTGLIRRARVAPHASTACNDPRRPR